MKHLKIEPRSRLWWKPTFLQISAPPSLAIYPEKVFVRLVEYEKLRSDRYDTPLSLVATRVGGCSDDDDAAAAAVVHTLAQRVRKTDAIGWLDDGRIGVLLPATDAAGAQAFAGSLKRELRLPCGEITVTTHPALSSSGVRPGGNGSGNGRPHQDLREDAPAGAAPAAASFEQTFVRPIPVWKRALDISGAGAGIILLAPLFAAVALFIKLVSPGPAFFTQPRVGRGGREFRFIKFRTMHPDNDQSLHNKHAASFIRSNGSMEKLDEHDPRIIFGGRVLRTLCIDELPQLYNVLRGEMSLVGPRPCIPYEAAEYRRWHRHRFSILPGLTGLWQVSGKNKLSFAEMIRLDIRYERTMSPGLDVVIILRTFPTVAGLFFEAVARRLRRSRAAKGRRWRRITREERT